MTEAEAAIADLDAALAEFGEDVRLQRLTIGPGGTQIPFEVYCRAAVRSYAPHELIAGSGIIQGDSQVIISPTQIERSGWPGPQPSGVGGRRVPRNGDKIVIGGRQRNIEAATPFDLAGTLVRIELQCRG